MRISDWSSDVCSSDLGCGLVEMVGGNDPGTVRLALDAAYDSPHRFQPADMGFGECLAGTRIMLQMRIDIVAPLVRHSDLRDRPVDLSHPPCARHSAPDRKSTRLNSRH